MVGIGTATGRGIENRSLAAKRGLAVKRRTRGEIRSAKSIARTEARRGQGTRRAKRMETERPGTDATIAVITDTTTDTERKVKTGSEGGGAQTAESGLTMRPP